MSIHVKRLCGAGIVLVAFGLGVWGSLSLQDKIQREVTKPASHELEQPRPMPQITIEC